MRPLHYAMLESINHNDYSFRHRGQTHFEKLFKRIQIKDSPPILVVWQGGWKFPDGRLFLFVFYV